MKISILTTFFILLGLTVANANCESFLKKMSESGMTIKVKSCTSL